MADNDYLGEHVAPSGKVDEHGVDPVTTDPILNDPEDATIVTEHAKAVVDHNREVLKKEAEDMDETDGPADTVTGEPEGTTAHDHVFSNDPWKRTFPPGPADPSKL